MGISARSAQELLEYVSTDFIMSEGVPSGEWHPTLLVSTLFPQGQYADPYISGQLIIKATTTFRCVRYVPLGGINSIVPAVQYYPVNVPANQPPIINLELGNDYVLQDGDLKLAHSQISLGAAALMGVDQYNLNQRPVTTFPGQFDAKRSSMYMLRPVNPEPLYG